MDRAHRIGQTQPVFAYRLIARDTVEEKIRTLQSQKKEMTIGVLGEEGFTRNLKVKDLRYIFDIGSETPGKSDEEDSDSL